MLSSAFLYSGHVPARPLELQAGPLTLRFEPDTACLRHIRLGDHEVVRALYAAVRNQDWSTILPRVTLTRQEIGTDSFRLAFDVHCARGPVNYSWQGEVTGDASGRIQFKFDGVANSDFLRNRIGICILHPIEECRGNKLVITHTDGSIEQGTFPYYISPHQPFFDIRAITYDIVNTGVVARLEVAGDTFEMEDQRNWSDASFKTYCTPLSRPLPHPVKKGDRVQQSVTLTLEGKVRSIPPTPLEPELSMATTAAVPLPSLGLCVASHGRPLTGREIDRLKALRLSHLRVDLRLGDPGYAELLERAWREAQALGAGLHVALELGPQSALPEFVRHLERIQPRVLLWILLHESENPISEAAVASATRELQKHAPTAAAHVAAGTRDFFTEVNRTRPLPEAASLLCYSNNPQVHAFDNTTLVENLAGQVYNVESARQFTKAPVVISPITLRLRANSQAARETAGALAELPSDVDPRQLSLFGAAWTLGSIARLAATDCVHSLTYYETTGWRGLMETEEGSLFPSGFPSEPGALFPMYHVFADIAEFRAQQVLPMRSTHPLLVEGFMLVNSDGARRILVANLSGDILRLKLRADGRSATIRYLDDTTAKLAVRSPVEFRKLPGEKKEIASGGVALELRPFASARVDILAEP